MIMMPQIYGKLIIGLVFALFLGHFVTDFLVNWLRKHTGEEVASNNIMAILIGSFERLLFFPLVACDMPGVATAIIAWIALKTAPDWERLKNEKNLETLKGPAFIRLLGNLLSMFFALVGGLICGGKISIPLL